MSTAAAIRGMLAAGLTVEQALIAVEAMEQAEQPYRRVLPKNWNELRAIVFERGGGQCRYCDRSLTFQTMQCDHVEPLARGGLSVVENLAASCKSCNSSKKDRSLSEWRR